MTITWERAEQLAVDAHGDSTMRSGLRFIDHVRRVASHFDHVHDTDAALGALLHDTVEKGTLTFDDLRAAGVHDRVIAIVDDLTERDGEPEREYLARCARHPTSLRIKRVDVADKLLPHRDVDAATAARVRRNAERRLALLDELAGVVGAERHA